MNTILDKLHKRPHCQIMSHRLVVEHIFLWPSLRSLNIDGAKWPSRQFEEHQVMFCAEHSAAARKYYRIQ